MPPQKVMNIRSPYRSCSSWSWTSWVQNFSWAPWTENNTQRLQ